MKFKKLLKSKKQEQKFLPLPNARGVMTRKIARNGERKDFFSAKKVYPTFGIGKLRAWNHLARSCKQRWRIYGLSHVPLYIKKH